MDCTTTCVNDDNSVKSHEIINIKELILFNLQTLIHYHKSMKEVFKVNAYKKALDKIKDLNKIVDEADINGIGGEKTKEKLKLIIKSKSNLPQVQEIIDSSEFNIINELLHIHGIGPVKAKELVDKYSIKSLADLRKRKDLLNNVQKKGLKYINHIKKRIPKEEMIKHEQFLNEQLNDFTFSISGSYRRGAQDSGDIDVLITGDQNKLTDCKTKLFDMRYLLKDGVFASGEHKFMGMCQLQNFKTARRIDMLYTPPSEFPFALLYFTGNFQFNITMRSHALSLGYSLNEQGLYDIETKKKVNHKFETEEDIFSFLEYPYVEPQNRL